MSNNEKEITNDSYVALVEEKEIYESLLFLILQQDKNKELFNYIPIGDIIEEIPGDHKVAFLKEFELKLLKTATKEDSGTVMASDSKIFDFVRIGTRFYILGKNTKADIVMSHRNLNQNNFKSLFTIQ